MTILGIALLIYLAIGLYFAVDAAVWLHTGLKEENPDLHKATADLNDSEAKVAMVLTVLLFIGAWLIMKYGDLE